MVFIDIGQSYFIFLYEEIKQFQQNHQFSTRYVHVEIAKKDSTYYF